MDVHLSLRDSVIKLDPLRFGLAGGQLLGTVALDGRHDPIKASAQLRARKLSIAKLFPTVQLNQLSIGELNGEVDLKGQGSSVGRMLASSNGKVGMVISGGEISQFMMEKVGLHLWEMLQLSITGDRRVKLRCAVADFEVTQGNMQASALVFDTEVTTITGQGHIDLGHEKLDLTIQQHTKKTSPLALRSPIHIVGSLARPVAEVDKVQVAARALGAVALGLVNPFLALIPLVDAGPGKDSDCGQLVRDAKSAALTAAHAQALQASERK
jgi:AsmA protein